MLKYFSCLFLVVIFSEHLSAQSTVNQIFTDYRGFWSSSTTSISTTLPSNSHNLLAFRIGTTIYSTGVNDARLIANGVTFVPQDFEALPVSTIGSGGLIGVGYEYGGVGNVSPVPVANNPIYYLTDGPKGLDLGTGIFNATGSNIYNVVSINPASIGDGIPDIIIPQIGDASTTTDRFYFTRSNGTVVGTPVNVAISGISQVANASWKFYGRTNPPTYGAAVAGNRAIRMIAYDFSALGINTSNYNLVAYFVHQLSGDSDQSFVAYNKTSVVILPVKWAQFNVKQSNNIVLLDWETSSEQNNAYFVVEKSTNATDWFEIERQSSKSENGNSNTSLFYETRDLRPSVGYNYYRVKQVDVNGKFDYSETKVVGIDLLPISIYPNPTIDLVEISGIAPESIVEIYSVSGLKIVSEKAKNTYLQLNVSGFYSGIYIVNIVNAITQERKQFKLVKN